jgi:hypothetical protein
MLSPYLSNLIEKAHLLAASGRFLSVSDIRSHLHREGFTHFELTALNGKAMRKQLRKLIEEATAGEREDGPAQPAPPPVEEV